MTRALGSTKLCHYLIGEFGIILTILVFEQIFLFMVFHSKIIKLKAKSHPKFY